MWLKKEFSSSIKPHVFLSVRSLMSDLVYDFSPFKGDCYNAILDYFYNAILYELVFKISEKTIL